MRKTVKKKKVEEESSWFNKPVFFSMGIVALASTITACTLLTMVLPDGEDSISQSPPRVSVTEEASKEPGPAMILGADLIENHLAISHKPLPLYELDEKEILFKCYHLAEFRYSCKLVQGQDPELSSTQEIKDTPQSPEAEKEEKENWKPFD